jgi:hypothetical protein
MSRAFACLALPFALACASAPEAPDLAHSTVWGNLRIVPREGVAAVTSGASAYGDRRYAGVELVDYSRPGFAVVYEDGVRSTRAAATATLEVHATPLGPRLAPAHAALAVGDTLSVANRAAEPHVVSIPAAGLVRRLGAGESVRVEVDSAGEWPVFLLDAPGEPTRVFAAPGAFAVVSDAGRFELADLPPGRHLLRAWHPRFPPAAAWVELEPGRSVRVDFALRVDGDPAGAADAP